MSRTRRAGLCLGLTLLLAACRDLTGGDSGDPRACQQTYEFGNTGCFEVQGHVVGTLGQPLRGMFVAARPRSERSIFDYYTVTSDSAGQFTIRLSRVLGMPPADQTPDTLSVSVIALDPSTLEVGLPARIGDSVLTMVMIAPVGVVPVPAIVRIMLLVP